MSEPTEVDEPPRRPRLRWRWRLVLVTLGLVAWMATTRGPFSRIDDNASSAWIEAQFDDGRAYVLEDGRRLMHDGKRPVVVGIREDYERFRAAGARSGARVELGAAVDGETAVTFWVQNAVGPGPTRTWNPFGQKIPAWRVHSRHTLRVVGTDSE